MCIALITTAHPKYALIVINNRDEFILRPTSEPHWWTIRVPSQHQQSSSPQNATASNGHPPSVEQNGNLQNGEGQEEIQHVLSSRDLLRAEQGAWLGITKAGHFAVLTNYREIDLATGAPSVVGTKSRGAMVTAWLGASRHQAVGDFVETMIADGGTTGVGGFTLICGKLRRRRPRAQGHEEATNGDHENNMEPMAVLSNKALHPDHIPWIAGQRDETIGLSNAAFDNPVEWPKVKRGKALLKQLIAEAAEKNSTEQELQDQLFQLLSRDELPTGPDMSLEDHFKVLQESIFIPLIGNQSHKDDMAKATKEPEAAVAGKESEPQQQQQPPPPKTGTQPAWFSTGMYGTQRQTVILVDWEGNVTFTERSLFDASGNPLKKGEGDVTFRFSIDGWDQSR